MVEIDALGIREKQDGVVVVNIGAAQIVRARLEHGFQSERPWLMVLLIAPTMAVGVFCVAASIGGAPLKVGAGGAAAVALASMMSYYTFRRGAVVAVETTDGVRRLFPRKEQVESLRIALARFG